MNHKKQSLRVNGEKIKSLRKKLGLTQVEFAKSSGYSERLVRKSESSGNIKQRTIRDFIRVFHQSGLSVSMHDLVAEEDYGVEVSTKEIYNFEI